MYSIQILDRVLQCETLSTRVVTGYYWRPASGHCFKTKEEFKMYRNRYLVISGIVGGVIGSLLTALLVSPVTAQRDKFDTLQCSKLEVVDANGGGKGSSQYQYARRNWRKHNGVCHWR